MGKLNFSFLFLKKKYILYFLFIKKKNIEIIMYICNSIFKIKNKIYKYIYVYLRD